MEVGELEVPDLGVVGVLEEEGLAVAAILGGMYSQRFAVG